MIISAMAHLRRVWNLSSVSFRLNKTAFHKSEFCLKIIYLKLSEEISIAISLNYMWLKIKIDLQGNIANHSSIP